MKSNVANWGIGCRSILEILNVSPEEREKLMKEAQKALHAASTVEIHKGWTYCKDELPEPGEEYLITYACDNSKKTFLSMSEFDVDYKWILDDDVKILKNVRVIAWMPLPEPAKEEN